MTAKPRAVGGFASRYPRLTLKASTLANADQLAARADEADLYVARAVDAPSRLTVVGPIDVLVPFLIAARANGWITADAGFEAAVGLLERVA